MSSVSYFQMYMRSIRYQTQHVDRLKKRGGSERSGDFSRSGWPLAQNKINVKLAAYSDACEAEIRYLKALEGFRRSASGPSIQNLIDAGHLSEVGS